MKRYLDKTGSSGVIAYEIQKDGILVRFRNGGTYLYNQQRPGKQQVAQMKKLAEQGAGLSTYISVHVREQYAAQVQ